MNWLGFLCLFHYAFTIKVPQVIITELFHDVALFAYITTFKIVQNCRFYILKKEQSTIACFIIPAGFIILNVKYSSLVRNRSECEQLLFSFYLKI